MTAQATITSRRCGRSGVLPGGRAWISAHPGRPRAFELMDEVAAGAKAAVLHFSGTKRLS